MAHIWAQIIAANGQRVTEVHTANPDRAQEMARALGAVVVATDRSLLPSGWRLNPPPGPLTAGPPPQLTVVCSAPRDHVADAVAAISRGEAVIIESPLCTTLAEADLLVAAVGDGARLAAAHNLLTAPLVVAAAARTRGLGAAHYVGVHASLPRTAHLSPDGSYDGGGVLFERGPQVLAVVLALLGWDTPVDVTARLTLDAAWPRDIAAHLELRLASGARCGVDLSWADDPGDASPAARFDVQVATTNSALRLELLPDPHLEQLGVDLPSPPRRWPSAPDQLEQFGHLDQLQHLTSALSAPEPTRAGPGRRVAAGSVELGRAMVDLVCAAYRSAGTGRPEPLPFQGPRSLTPWQIFQASQLT